MMNEERHLGCDLKVVPCGGWKRQDLFPHWGKIWQAPSPALMSFENVLLYPGMCLMEGTNLSEGRGTAAPFRIIGADYVDAEQLMTAFNQAGLPGVIATPVWFTPTASKHQGENCGGILLHVTDAGAFRPVEAGITLLDIVRKLYPDQFEILPVHKDFGRPMLAMLSGGDKLLGDWDREDMLAGYREDSMLFSEKKEKYHLY